jgi:hypothetical protein
LGLRAHGAKIFALGAKRQAGNAKFFAPEIGGEKENAVERSEFAEAAVEVPRGFGMLRLASAFKTFERLETPFSPIE